MYSGREDADNLVWDKNEEDEDRGLKRLRLKTFCRKVVGLVEERLGLPATLIPPLIPGSYNVHYRIRQEGTSPDLLVRLPRPAALVFPEHKTLHEAAAASLVASCTQLPIPRQLCYAQESPVGPFIIMEWVENKGTISRRLARPDEDPLAAHVLDPDVTSETLAALWLKVAHCLLEISHIALPKIGSLLETSHGVYEVADRPISHNMNDMVALANIPRSILPQEGETYATADEWYTALADMHIAQLVFQHNDVVESEADCRNKYVARQVFRRLAREGKLSIFGFADDKWSAQSAARRAKAATELAPAPSGVDSFRLWGDDFRAGNILLNDSDEIAALVDWEFAYSAPTQFILDPPWWLLLQTIEWWSDGIDSWVETYEERLGMWLAAMEQAERDADDAPSAKQQVSHCLGAERLPAPLSRYMRESWETGRFFLNYAARKSWAFDALYWRYLDERFFGKREEGTAKDDLWKTRIHLLSRKEREAMEGLVQQKMADMEDRRIVDWDPAEAKRRLGTFLLVKDPVSHRL
ncbi:phosphotransferase [Microdochium trichocladiopsis]|uniref:Phosphotransferase n=1 Tax=Microdochium trichocladiopsis TaxID=1682393 RepID=A0A9P8Y655_9PEZI|nr:phosphotransferase [Microdochium trichocladiopsis]KAH7029775.1 phosphotransferase [Microdochium trichocladiopsis]